MAVRLVYFSAQCSELSCLKSFFTTDVCSKASPRFSIM